MAVKGVDRQLGDSSVVDKTYVQYFVLYHITDILVLGERIHDSLVVCE